MERINGRKNKVEGIRPPDFETQYRTNQDLSTNEEIGSRSMEQKRNPETESHKVRMFT